MSKEFLHIILHLKQSDPILGAVIDRVKLRPLIPHSNHFRSLVEAIISQQLSDAAANTIIKRFSGLCVDRTLPLPEQVLRLQHRQIRRAGISLQKILYIKNIARAVHSGSLDFEHLQELADEEVIAELTRLKGIGRWTAEMFLMFSFCRPDIFSYGDLGLRNAITKLYRIRGELTEAKAQKIASRWSPYRTYACRYLWASLRLNDNDQET